MKIALTFDDGPGPHTPAIHDVLREHAARATFFVLGENVAGGERTLRRALAEGHELGNHTFSHPRPSELSEAELRDELARTNAALRGLGVEPRLARPPYGDDAKRFARVAATLGLETVLWTVAPRDWLEPPVERLVDDVLLRAGDGAIVDLHDGRRCPRATVEALGVLVPELQRRGFDVVTVSELLGWRP